METEYEAGQKVRVPRSGPSPWRSRAGDFHLWPYRIVRLALAMIFLWSGAAKLLNPQSFATILDAYGILPDGLIGFVAIGLPALEVVLAFGLMLDIQGSLAIVAVLLALFMAILGYGNWLGLDIECGCFGPGDPEAEAYQGLRPALYRDLFMLGGVVFLYLWRYRRRAKPIRLGDFIKACRRRSS